MWGREGDSLKVGRSCFGVHTVACSACISRHCTIVAKMSTMLRSSQNDSGYVAEGRGVNIPSVIGMLSCGMLS